MAFSGPLPVTTITRPGRLPRPHAACATGRPDLERQHTHLLPLMMLGFLDAISLSLKQHLMMTLLTKYG